MLANLIPLPMMIILAMIQISALSRIALFNGNVDLVLLAIAAWGIRSFGRNVYLWALVGGIIISYVTAIPFYLPLIVYVTVALLSRIVHTYLWQSPILSMIIVTAAGIVFQHLVYMIGLQITGIEIGLINGFLNVTFPSLLINLIFLIPMYVLLGDIGKWLMPESNNE